MASRYASWVFSENPRSTMWSQKRFRSTLLPSLSIRCLLKCLVPATRGTGSEEAFYSRTSRLTFACNESPTASPRSGYVQRPHELRAGAHGESPVALPPPRVKVYTEVHDCSM